MNCIQTTSFQLHLCSVLFAASLHSIKWAEIQSKTFASENSKSQVLDPNSFYWLDLIERIEINTLFIRANEVSFWKGSIQFESHIIMLKKLEEPERRAKLDENLCAEELWRKIFSLFWLIAFQYLDEQLGSLTRRLLGLSSRRLVCASWCLAISLMSVLTDSGSGSRRQVKKKRRAYVTVGSSCFITFSTSRKSAWS